LAVGCPGDSQRIQQQQRRTQEQNSHLPETLCCHEVTSEAAAMRWKVGRRSDVKIAALLSGGGESKKHSNGGWRSDIVRIAVLDTPVNDLTGLKGML
jgi:hypothetical protein